MVIAIIAVLAALLLPGLAQARQRAEGVVCLSNLKQLQLASARLFQELRELHTSRKLEGNFAEPLRWSWHLERRGLRCASDSV